jgi:lipopolysaccharide/colanic/teichoic acid biosynthesis glycosyltransferase
MPLPDPLEPVDVARDEATQAGNLTGRVTSLPPRATETLASSNAYAWFKRAMDVAGALVLLILLSPLLLAAAVAIRLDSPGPILFRQRRIGRGSMSSRSSSSAACRPARPMSPRI